MNATTNKKNRLIEEDTVSIEGALSATPTKKKQPRERKAQAIKEATQPIENESMTNEGMISESFTHEVTSPRYWSKLFWLFVIFSFSWLFYSTLITIIEAWQSNNWFGIPLAVISVAFMLVLILLIKRERDAFRRVDESATQKLSIQNAIENDSVVGIHRVLKHRFSRIKKQYPKEYAQFDEARSDRHSTKEYLSLLENVLLSRLDKDVDHAIKKASLSIAALVAISPHPAFDAFLVLMRANSLIRKISHIYGLEPTGLSSMYLLKHSIISALAAAGVEEVSTLMAEEISLGLSEKAAQFIAEGAVSSARLYRLGHLTKKITRPISSGLTP